MIDLHGIGDGTKIGCFGMATAIQTALACIVVYVIDMPPLKVVNGGGVQK